MLVGDGCQRRCRSARLQHGTNLIVAAGDRTVAAECKDVKVFDFSWNG